jgi:RNA polymerase sigma-70 factor (ECF subfamily)
MVKARLKHLIGSPNDLEARKLVAAVTSGDRMALSNLYESFYRILAYFLSQVVGCHRCVADVIDDTFMTVWERAREFHFELKVSVWILSIAHSHAANSAGWHATRGFARREGEYEGKASGPGTPIDMRRPFLRALWRLSAEQRAVLTLCYRMGYSAREIALITDSPVETVELRLLQGRQRLRRFLTPYRGARRRAQPPAIRHGPPSRPPDDS